MERILLAVVFVSSIAVLMTSGPGTEARADEAAGKELSQADIFAKSEGELCFAKELFR